MSLRTRIVAGVAAIAMSAAGVLFVQKHESTVYQAYADPVHGWAVPTICAGHTAGVKRGHTATKAQCLQYLRDDSGIAVQGVLRCTTAPLNQHQLDALASFAFNVGVGNYCKSTLARMLNRNDPAGAANQFTRWVYAGGKDCRIRSNNCYGIVTRRNAERTLFMTGNYAQ